MGLERQLGDFNAKFEVSTSNDAAAFLNSNVEELTTIGLPFDRDPKPGDLAPDFSLRGVKVETISLVETLCSGVDLAAMNGDDARELPIPATFVIGRNARVQLTHPDADYHRRLSPEAIVDALRAAEAARQKRPDLKKKRGKP